jgi:type I restriction enzyme R subunit
MTTPEQKARRTIDALLTAAGWQVQDRAALDLGAGRGVAVREFPLKTGFADYLLFVDRKAIGAVEAKAEGMPLSGIETQSEKYGAGLPDVPPAWRKPLPFLYESTGVETYFTNGWDPDPRSRRAFAFHRPETMAEWAGRGVVGADVRGRGDEGTDVRGRGVQLNAPTANDRATNAPTTGDRATNAPTTDDRATNAPATDDRAPHAPLTLRGRLRTMPALNTTGLWSAQVEAVTNLERSLAAGRQRALIQMATGSGKTFTAVSFIYRLIKFADARRVLFLVDRSNLGRQTLKEFQQYVTPDDGRKFTELYNVQRLQSNTMDPVSRVCITTIQRLYSMLAGEVEFDPANEEGSLFELGGALDLDRQPPKEVRYNPGLPIEYFDVIVTDECHRSIYNLWRGALEYFDSFIIGLTATPNKQTFGFFEQNLVMEYSRQRAVADAVNVEGQVYRIRTAISEGGGKVDAGFFVDKRDRQTRRRRWEELDDDLVYTASQLDRDVVAEDQIRTVVRTFRDRLFTDIFPGRREVPKTLIFAKDDSHAKDIVRIAREEFGKGNDFCQKITYKVTGAKPEDLIAAFRNSYNPRIAVTVDMIATGTDVKPLEILLFMRQVQSRGLFEQMLGRGTRVISATDLQAVTPDAGEKTRFVLIDAVGVVDHPKVDVGTLDRKRSVSFDKLLEAVAVGARDEDTLTSLAARLGRMEKSLSDGDRRELRLILDGDAESNRPTPLRDLANALLDATDPDAIAEVTGSEAPDPAQMAAARESLAELATRPFDKPSLRQKLVSIQKRNEQTIDTVSRDRVMDAGFTDSAPRTTIDSFRQYIREHQDEITALQIIFSRPRAQQRLSFGQVKELAEQLEQPPRNWTTQSLWQAYAQLERDRVRGATGKRVLTDLISLVRHAAQMDDELVPFPDLVRARYNDWFTAQEQAGQKFTLEQRWWLDKIAEHVAVNVAIREDDLGGGEFFAKGGLFRARQAFGSELGPLLEELNGVLVG